MSELQEHIAEIKVSLPVRPIEDVIDLIVYDNGCCIVGSPYFGVVIALQKSKTKPDDRPEEIDVTIYKQNGDMFQTTYWCRTYTDTRQPSVQLLMQGIKTDEDCLIEYGRVHDLVKKLIISENIDLRSVGIRIRQQVTQTNGVVVYKDYSYPQELHFFTGHFDGMYDAAIRKAMHGKKYEDGLWMTVQAAHAMGWTIEGKEWDLREPQAAEVASN